MRKVCQIAVCGVDLSDEELKEEQKSDEKITEEQKEALTFDHSLSNVVTFSTTTKQRAVNSKEGLLVKEEDGTHKDRRIKVVHKDYKYWLSSIYSALQMTASLPSGRKAMGSGLAIILNGQPHMLTCAHNLAAWSEYTDRFELYTKGCCYSGRNGEEDWRTLFQLHMDKSRIHPKFNDDDAGGFDIGVCPMTKVKNGTLPEVALFSDCAWGCAKPESLKAGMKIELAGYPAEKEKKGYQYISAGEIVKVKHSKYGGWVLYHDADTTKGMSGTPIRIVDKDWLEDNLTSSQKKRGKKKKTIGIHTGHDVSNVNHGTLITPELYNWIQGNE